MGDGGDAVEIAMHRGVAVDMRLRDFPIVDAGIARLAGIGQHDALRSDRPDRPGSALRAMPAGVSSIALTPPYIAG